MVLLKLQMIALFPNGLLTIYYIQSNMKDLILRWTVCHCFVLFLLLPVTHIYFTLTLQSLGILRALMKVIIHRCFCIYNNFQILWVLSYGITISKPIFAWKCWDIYIKRKSSFFRKNCNFGVTLAKLFTRNNFYLQY